MTKKYKCLMCKKEFEPSKWALKRLEKFDIDYLNNLDSTKKYDHQVPLCSRSCVTKYGYIDHKSPFARKEVREKAKQTLIEKTGFANPWCKGAPGRKTCEKTNLERSGFANPWCKGSPARDKAVETYKKIYGCSSNFARKDVIEKTKQTVLNNKLNDLEWIDRVVKKYHKTMLEKYGVTNSLFLNPAKTISKTNKLLAEKLKQLNVETEFEFYLDGFYYDLHILNTNILIEINPTYTHNSTFGTHWNNKPLAKDYHFNKTKIALKAGFKVIHIWDWDDINKIIENLKDRKSIGARKTEVKQISKRIAKQFLNKYHLQSSTHTCQYAYGLFYNDELIQVMTFGKPRYNKSYEYELLRLCTKPKIKVIGGASKLFKHFIEDLKPKSIISYCDLSKFNGDVYEKLGMTLKNDGSPTKHWHNYMINSHFTDNLLRQRGFDQLFGTSYGKGTSNEQLMIEHGYVEVYDVGQSTYVLNLEYTE